MTLMRTEYRTIKWANNFKDKCIFLVHYLNGEYIGLEYIK